MDDSLSNSVDAYISCEGGGAEGGTPPLAAAALEEVCREVPSRVSLPQLVRDMGEYLTHEDGVIRRRATTLLAVLLERASPAVFQAGTSTGQTHHVLLTFFLDRLDDYPSVAPCLRAIRALLVIAAAAPALNPGATLAACKGLFSKLQVQAMEQGTRQQTYELLEYVLVTPHHAAALAEKPPPSASSDSPYALDFAVGFVNAMDGEKDPRCLLVALRIARVLLTAATPVPPTSGARSPPGVPSRGGTRGFGDLVASFTAELFDVTACYFPITFTPPPNDPYGISKEALVSTLRGVFAASPRMATLVTPLLLEKLASPSTDVKRDILQTMQACMPKYGIPALRDVLTEVASALQREVLTARDVPASTGSDAFEPAGRLLANLWTGSSHSSVGLSAGSIGLNFSGSVDVHANTGYGLYVAKGANATKSSSSSVTEVSVTDEALLTLAALTRQLSRHVQATGSQDEWHLFVSPLVRAALTEVSRAAESMAGRSSARILCALASASHHALSSVLEASIPVISAVYEEATAHHRLSVRTSVLALLSGLLHTVDHGIDHAAGHHPLSKHLSRIYDMLLETLELPLLPPMPTSSGVSSATQALLTAASEARCIAAAGLCDIAVRPPSAVLAVEQKFQITAQFTTIFLTDADDLVREACLRALCTMASVRQRFCSAVLVAAVPRLLAVLREAFTEPSSSSLHASDSHPSASTSNSATEDGSSVLTVPTITSAEWYASMHAPGVSDDVSRALYALGQLCCISNLRVHHVVVPQLLELAVEALPTRGDSTPSRRPAIALRGTNGATAARGPSIRAIAVAIIETLGRMVSTKATVSDVAAMDALLINSPEALATYAELLNNTGGSIHLLTDSTEIRTESSRRSVMSDDSGRMSGEGAKQATTVHSNSSQLAAGILHDQASVEGSSPQEEGGPEAPPPMLLVPTLLHLIMDHARGYASSDVEARMASLTLTPGGSPAESTSTFARRSPLPARVRTAIELIFRVAAIRASPQVQDAFREAVSRLLLGLPPSVKTRSSPSSAASGEAGAPCVLSIDHAPWFQPLAPDAPQDMLRHLPALLKVLACSRRGAPVPMFAELAHALAHVVFELRFPHQRTCEDARQRHHARLAWALSRTTVDTEDEMVAPAAADASAMDIDSAPAARAASSSRGQVHVDMQRTAIIAAQALGMMMNRHPAGGDHRATFDAVLCTVLQCIVKRSGLGNAAFAGALAAATGAAPSSDAPPIGLEAITIARERGVVLLVWLCKGLAMRAHSLAQQCLAALVSVISANDVAWMAHAPLDAHIVTLAGQGLGVILADAAPRHPFHKDAGAAVIGLYKQKLFSAVFSQYKTLATALRPHREASVDDSSTIISTTSSVMYGGGTPASATPPASPIAISAFVGTRSELTEASAARMVPLLLSLCAMAAHLPQNVLLSEIDKVLPLVVRALEIITPVDATAVTGGSSSAVRRPHLSAESLGLTSEASFEELRDAVAISALLCLRLLVQHAPSDVAVHLHSLVPVLVVLARFSPAHVSKPLVRATAIDCLRGFVALPYHRLHPVRSTVVQGLYVVLDDPKRAVRRRAAACRNDWMTLSTGGGAAGGK